MHDIFGEKIYYPIYNVTRSIQEDIHAVYPITSNIMYIANNY